MGARVLIDRIVGSFAAKPRGVRRADRLTALLRTLTSERGEATGAVLARRAVALYLGLDAAGRQHFFQKLARDFAPDRDAVLKAAFAYHANATPAHLASLQRVVEPARQEVFRRMNMAPGGTAVLVEMRRELLAAIKAHPELEAVDHDLTHLLGSWFNRGFLELRRIDWSTPAAILEKIIRYEAVHEIRDWEDLRRRVDPPDRRCYAFFHPALVDEPLIFVEVALTRDIPGAIAPILSDKREEIEPARATTAVFYSITNCQRGLNGVTFGHFLIKQVVEEVSRELPRIGTFVTLSPAPNFAEWLNRERARSGSAAIDDADRQTLA